MLVIHAHFKEKSLGTALQIYFMGDYLALLIGPMLNMLFVEQRDNSSISNSMDEPQQLEIHQPSHASGFENSTSWNDSGVLTLQISSAPCANLTSADQREQLLNEYTVLPPYYTISVMSMAFASVVSFYIVCTSKTVKNVLAPRQKRAAPGIKKGPNQFGETTLLAGLVILEFCRSMVGNSTYGLMVTYLMKHLKMRKMAASQVTSIWSLGANLSQLVAIVFIRFIPAPVLLGISYFMMTIVNVAFTLSVDHHIWVVWIWATLTGALLPFVKLAVYTWFYQAISVTAFRTSLILVGLFAGGIVGPALVGYLMTRYNPGWFVFSLDGILVCSHIVFVVTFVYYRFVMRKNCGYKGRN